MPGRSLRSLRARMRPQTARSPSMYFGPEVSKRSLPPLGYTANRALYSDVRAYSRAIETLSFDQAAISEIDREWYRSHSTRRGARSGDLPGARGCVPNSLAEATDAPTGPRSCYRASAAPPFFWPTER